MTLIEDIKENVELEIRPNSRGAEYLEAVMDTKNLPSLVSIVKKHLGPPAKEGGKPVDLPTPIQKIVDGLGGLRIEQSFFCKKEGAQVTFVALWPWESNPERITVKAGVSAGEKGLF